MTILYWIDLETTSLDPLSAEILEIAVLKSNFNNPFEVSLVMNKVLAYNGYGLEFEGMENEIVYNMHKNSGLLDKCKKSNNYIDSIENELLNEVPDIGIESEKSLIAGSSVHYDRSVIASNMPRLYKRFNHQIYDVTSVYKYCMSLDMPELSKPIKKHKALDDILQSVRLGYNCYKWINYCSCRILDFKFDGNFMDLVEP